MKELTTEQKAKAYDKALEIANAAYEDEDRHLKATLERIFPELTESEDERIRKVLIELVKCNERSGYKLLNNVPTSSMIAWLEKQGEKKPAGKMQVSEELYEYIRNTCACINDALSSETLTDINDYLSMAERSANSAFDMIEKQGEPKSFDNVIKEITKNKETAISFLKSCGIMNANGELADEYKIAQDEQKPTDKVEPKFKVGDWICNDMCIIHITSIENGMYYFDEGDGLSVVFVDEHYHLWTIQDAEEGDVVVDKSDGAIGIFQSIGHHDDGGSYNDPSYCFLHCRYDDGFFYADFEHGNTIDSNDIIPATKEQSGTLFAKMGEAGYMWDSVNKRLLSLEQIYF